MKTNKILNKVALAFAILTVIAFVIAISPAILTIILALAALFITMFALVVIVLGGFVALLALPSGTGVWDSVWALTGGSFGLAGGIFSIIPPMAEFCFTTHLSQICAAIGIGLGVVAFIFSIVAMSVKAPQNEEGENEFVEPVEEQTDDTGKKKKAKKPKTDRSVSITCLVVSIIFTVLNGIAIFVTNALAQAYFGA